jgi:hypothetical protein
MFKQTLPQRISASMTQEKQDGQQKSFGRDLTTP